MSGAGAWQGVTYQNPNPIPLPQVGENLTSTPVKEGFPRQNWGRVRWVSTGSVFITMPLCLS